MNPIDNRLRTTTAFASVWRVKPVVWSLMLALGLTGLTATAQDPPPAADAAKPEYPPFDQVIKGDEKVVSTADGQPSLYTLYIDRKKNRLFAELNPRFEGQRIFIATSIAGGSPMTGYQWKDLYAYWNQNDNKLVLLEPNLQRQARGGQQDAELRSTVQRTYTDRVVTSVPILCFGPSRGPVINLGDLLIGNSQLLTDMKGDASLATIGKVKAFPQNIEVPVVIPMDGGRLTKIHYSISAIPKTEYKPREADERVGYFMTVFKDFAKSEDDGNQFTRYINRWNIQKRDAQLTMSPPNDPIVFYVEHTVPVRYRRHVRDGILEWNKAFEAIGIIGAVEVRQQDAQTGAFMEIDPEDVRYNFFRWISSERAFAMGPSRVNPESGQILDADIIFDDSMLKSYRQQYLNRIRAYGLDGVDPAAIKLMQDRPLWNPLTRFASADPARDSIITDSTLTDEQKADMLGEPALAGGDKLHTSVVQQSRACDYAEGASLQMQTAALAAASLGLFPTSADGTPTGPTIDGVPEEYLGTILRQVVMHEVGHTLGLRHNFKASSWKTLDEYGAAKGQASVGSVMDYNPVRVVQDADKRGDWVPTTLGPYDYWAIEYGYGFDDKHRAELVKQSADPRYQFATDEDTTGPDPLVARFDLSSDPLSWSKERMQLVRDIRSRLLEKAVDDDESWHLLRRAYEQLLGEQLGALRTAARFVGGVYINRDRRGTQNGREPVVPVDAAKQRDALTFVLDNAFRDDAFDLRPELLAKLATDKQRHWGSPGDAGEAFDIQNRVAQIQAFAVLYLLNPGVLERVYDNELRTSADTDALTLPEVLDSISNGVFGEFNAAPTGGYSARKPMVSNLRRNLQSMAIDALIDLALRPPGGMPAPTRTLAAAQLRSLDGKLAALAKSGAELDPYTMAHIEDLHARISSAMNAITITEL